MKTEDEDDLIRYLLGAFDPLSIPTIETTSVRLVYSCLTVCITKRSTPTIETTSVRLVYRPFLENRHLSNSELAEILKKNVIESLSEKDGNPTLTPEIRERIKLIIENNDVDWLDLTEWLNCEDPPVD